MARTYCCVVQTVASLPVSQALDPRVRSIDVDAQNTVEIFLHPVYHLFKVQRRSVYQLNRETSVNL